MALTKERKKEIIEKFKMHEKDTGSSVVQIALLTERIKIISEHLKKHRKDHHSRLGLIKLVNKRRKYLEYLKQREPDKYYWVIKELEIRG